MMKMIAFPFETGLSLKAVRTALNTLTDLGVGDQGSTSLFGDGTTINHCRTYDEIIDLLAAGREVFSVAVPVLIQNHLTTTSTPNPTQQ
ncbi:MerR family transcriptional regulator, partial [Corynebacterium bovis]